MIPYTPTPAARSLVSYHSDTVKPHKLKKRAPAPPRPNDVTAALPKIERRASTSSGSSDGSTVAAAVVSSFVASKAKLRHLNRSYVYVNFGAQDISGSSGDSNDRYGLPSVSEPVTQLLNNYQA